MPLVEFMEIDKNNSSHRLSYRRPSDLYHVALATKYRLPHYFIDNHTNTSIIAEMCNNNTM
jgi:hypothetical protein